uniref:G-protein coupled receptors family 1 profile domain-containing protein n=1 Tax=Callorhinchus milii TaxID=7868 RepID=A0A4W3HLC3_CALMI
MDTSHSPPFNYTLSCNSSESVPYTARQVIQCVTTLSVLTIITLLTVLGNVLVIASIAYFTKLQTPTNAFILSLATADILVGLVVMPFSMVKAVFGWYFGRIFCKIHSIMDVMLCTSSIVNLSCIAFDRYFAVCYPLKYRFTMSRKRVTFLLLICWILPALVSIVPLVLDLHVIGLEDSFEQLDSQDCVFVVNIPYSVTASIIAFYLPMPVILVAYAKIFLVATNQVREIAARQQGMNLEMIQQNSSIRKERKAAKTLGIIIGCFLLCWVPFFTLNIIDPLLGYQADSILIEVFLWLGYLNSGLNPFLYAFFNKSFRRALHQTQILFLLISFC